jgi:hypothetical protein
LSLPSCSPPRLASHYLTVGTPDTNGNPASSTGEVKLKVVGENPINTENGNQADVQITSTITDVRKQSDLSDYTGQLRGVLGLRITDRLNGTALDDPATATNLSLPFTIGCTTTSGPEGGTCNVATTANALSSGSVQEGKRAVWALDQIRIYDGGADGFASTTGDNTLFETQGLFTP